MNKPEFRPLNSNEEKVITHLASTGRIKIDDIRLLNLERLKVSYEYMQGGFCVRILVINKSVSMPLEFGSLVWRGASRRSYKDPRKPIRGEMLAFSRAILYSRPVELS